MPTPATPALIHEDADGGLVLFCPAKVNLALSVGPARADGLHPVASWMVPVAFGDTLTLRRADTGEPDADDASGGSGTTKMPGVPGVPGVRIGFASDAPRPGVVDWPNERDLSVRAWRGVERAVGRSLPIDAALRKRVPAGAGLGGGSADAAAMLDGLNRLFALELSEPELLAIAAGLGSDVVFQLGARLQPGGAVVTGTGEAIERLPQREPTPLLLVLPAVACPTGEVYAAFDAMHGADNHALDPARVRALVAQRVGAGSALFNDLAEPACRVRPALRGVLNAAASTGMTPHVTGSGAAVFVVAKPGGAAALERQRAALAKATGCAVVVTWTMG